MIVPAPTKTESLMNGFKKNGDPKAGTVEGLSAWAQPYGVGITPAAKV